MSVELSYPYRKKRRTESADTFRYSSRPDKLLRSQLLDTREPLFEAIVSYAQSVISARRSTIHRDTGRYKPGCIVPKPKRPECGARLRGERKGQFCKAKPVWDREKNKPRNGRCRLHGGLCTGPRTVAGRNASRRNLGKYYKGAMEEESPTE